MRGFAALALWLLLACVGCAQRPMVGDAPVPLTIERAEAARGGWNDRARVKIWRRAAGRLM